MRLIICPPMQLPAINGTTIYAKQLSDYFNARVISTNALDWIAFHSLKGKTHGEGFKINHLPSLMNNESLSFLKKQTSGLLNSFVNGPVSRGLFNALVKSGADIIHSLTLPFLNNYYSYWASKLIGSKFVITPFYIKGLVNSSHKRLLSKADLVLACTNYEKECIGSGNIKVLPMSINPEPFFKADGKRFREKYSISGKMVLFVGHANLVKGAYSLLEAAKSVKATFVFLGPHTRGFKSRARGLSNVRLINPQLRNKFDAFAACDVYAMPSQVEAFGITYLEAWACKKPVIALNTPVAREVIGDAGFLVNNVSELINAINESFNRKDLGVKGFNRLLKHFTEEKVLNHLNKFLRKL